MGLILSLFFILLSIVFFRINRKFSDPMFIVCCSWGVSLFLYEVVDHGMPILSTKVLNIFFLWVISFLIGCLCFNYFKAKNKLKLDKFDVIYNLKNNVLLRRNLNIYFWISVICFFPQVYLGYKQAISESGNLFLNMRLASAGLIEKKFDAGIFGYGKTFTIITLLIYLLIYRKGDSKYRILILFLMYFILSIIAVGKSQFLFLIISMFIVWSFRKKISKTTILAGILFLISIFSALQIARSDEGINNDKVVSQMFYSYFFAGMPALDRIVNSRMESSEFAQNSFQFFNRLTKVISDNNLSKEYTYEFDITNGGYMYVPVPTNVYTIIGPFWLDFKYEGVLCFGFIYGLIFGFLYKKFWQMKIYGLVTYSLFVSTLILPFFGEFIFSYLSYFLQVLILTYFVNKPILTFLYPKKYFLNNKYY